MVCITNCLVGAALVGGTIATALVSRNDPVFKQYIGSLTPSQVTTLNKISEQRLNLYIQGTLLGLILVVLFSLFAGKKLSPFTNGCSFIVIVLLTQYFYYILMPKQDWMVKHLTTQKQNTEWLNVYRHMSFRWHFGMLIGLIGFFLLGRGIVA